jgi:hypothetical protein
VKSRPKKKKLWHDCKRGIILEGEEPLGVGGGKGNDEGVNMIKIMLYTYICI